MEKFGRWLGCFAILLLGVSDGGGADDYTITDPSAGENFVPTANIDTQGARPLFTNVKVKLECLNPQTGVWTTLASSTTLQGGMATPTWTNNFTAPAHPGWTLSDATHVMKVILYKVEANGDLTFKKSQGYNVHVP